MKKLISGTSLRAAKLYWVSTPQGSKNWFVVAHDQREAEMAHETYDGYDRGAASAELVSLVAGDDLPLISGPLPCHPTWDLIEACGGQWAVTPLAAADAEVSELLGTGLRVVTFGSRSFRKGAS